MVFHELGQHGRALRLHVAIRETSGQVFGSLASRRRSSRSLLRTDHESNDCAKGPLNLKELERLFISFEAEQVGWLTIHVFSTYVSSQMCWRVGHDMQKCQPQRSTLILREALALLQESPKFTSSIFHVCHDWVTVTLPVDLSELTVQLVVLLPHQT